MPTFTYVGESAREYPFPPITRVLTPGDEVDFESEQDVPDDRRFEPVAPPAQPPAAKTAAKPTKATKADKAPDPVKE